MPLAEVFSPAAQERVAEFADFVNRDGYLRYETEHVRLDGSTFPVDTEVVAARAEDGRLLYRVAYVSDITEQRAREESEHRAVTLFATALDKAPIGMCLIGLDGRFLRVNEALCRLAGRAEDELLEFTFQQLTHPDDIDLDLTLYQECLRAQRAGYEVDKRYVRSDGEVIEARLSVSLIRDGAGHPVHFVCQIVDLTERSRLEEQLGGLDPDFPGPALRPQRGLAAAHRGRGRTDRPRRPGARPAADPRPGAPAGRGRCRRRRRGPRRHLRVDGRHNLRAGRPQRRADGPGRGDRDRRGRRGGALRARGRTRPEHDDPAARGEGTARCAGSRA